MNVCAIIPTRGDVDMAPVLASLPERWDRVVWDNSAGPDYAVYGRYAAIEQTEAELIFVQDDDAVVSKPERIIEAWEGVGRRDALAANMPERFRQHYPDSCLVGFGACFHRDLPELLFERFARRHYHTTGEAPPFGPWLLRYCQTFERTCDVVLSTLAPRILVDIPYREREFASDDNRMWKQPYHVAERAAMLGRAREAREAE